MAFCKKYLQFSLSAVRNFSLPDNAAKPGMGHTAYWYNTPYGI